MSYTWQVVCRMCAAGTTMMWCTYCNSSDVPIVEHLTVVQWTCGPLAVSWESWAMVSRCLLVRVRLISCSPYRRCLDHCPPTKWSCSILTGVSVDSGWVDNNNTQDDIHSAVIYSAKPYARVHFGSCERKSVCARWLPTCRPSWKLDLLSPRRMEDWVDLDTAVSVHCSPCLWLHIAVIFMKSTETWPQHGFDPGLLTLQARVLPLDHCDVKLNWLISRWHFLN